MSNNKPRVIKAFEKLDEGIQEQIKLQYPYGFSDNLINFNDQHGNLVSALPFETEEKYYMVKMTVREAERIIEDDDDYNDSGMLKKSVKSDYEDKYPEMEGLDQEMELEVSDDSDDDDSYDDNDDSDDDDDFDDE